MPSAAPSPTPAPAPVPAPVPVPVPGDLIGTGRSADVYALDDAWVLRRYRDGQTTGREAAVMAHLHAHGYPVPETRPADPAAPADLVLRRLAGPTLAEAGARGTLSPAEAGTLLAGLLTRLHAVPPTPDAPAGTSVLHLDFHPLNVLLTPDGPMVIDWGNAEPGPPALDWALSALILALAAGADLGGLGALAAAMLGPFLAAAPAASLPDAATLERAHAYRAADPNLSAEERALLPEAVRLVAEQVARAREAEVDRT